MENIDIVNGIVLQKMGISKDTFNDRLIAQKKIYLLQSLGTKLGYEYNWYIRGPYSPVLTSYIYANIDMLLSTDFSKYEISEKAKNDIETVNSLKDCCSEIMSISSWYELLASLLYIINNQITWNVKTNDEIFKTLCLHKPQYNTEGCNLAYEALKSKGFIKG